MIDLQTTLKFYHDGIKAGVKSPTAMEKFDAEACQPWPQRRSFGAKRGKFLDNKASTIFRRRLV